MVKYVVKKGGKFLTLDGTYSENLEQADLYATRKIARTFKSRGEKIYRVKLDLVKNSFEKVS